MPAVLFDGTNSPPEAASREATGKAAAATACAWRWATLKPFFAEAIIDFSLILVGEHLKCFTDLMVFKSESMCLGFLNYLRTSLNF
jgi:hypothetical protein